MVQIFDAPENQGDLAIKKIAEAFGGGFSQGIKTGISTRLSEMLSRKKEVGKIRSDFDKLYKQYEKGTYDPTVKQGLEKRAIELLNEGRFENSTEATLGALQEYEQKAQMQQQQKQQKSTDLQKQLGETRKPQIPLTSLTEPKPEGFWERVIQGTGRGAVMNARMLEEQYEAFPQLAAGGLEGATLGAAKILPPTSEAGKIHREAGKLAGLGKTFGTVQKGISKLTKPSSFLGKLFTGSATGAAISSAQQLIEKGEIDPKQLGIDTAIWTGIEGAFLAAPQIMRFFRGNIETIAKETGKPAQAIIEEISKSSGTDFGKVLEGDAKEINKFSKELSGEAESLAKKVEETPKETFKSEPAIKRREKTSELFKSRASPLEEYFAPEKEVTKRAETIAKEAEVTSRVKPLIEDTNKALQEQRSQLRDLMAERRGKSGAELERVESLIGFKQRSIDKTLKELKDLQYELKYSRTPPTEAEIDAQIKKSGEEFAAEAKNPTEKGQKDIKRQLELDKKYIERAEKLIERGELTNEIRPDTFMKMKRKYLDGYNAIIKEQREMIREFKGARDEESLKKIADSRSFIANLENRIPRLKADLVNQSDKLKSMAALSGPPGAFYKQQLRGLRPEIEAFQKDFFRHQRLKNIQPLAKTEKVAEKALQSIKNIGEEVGKKPTEENIKKAAESVGEKPENLGKVIESFGKKIEERAEVLKAGKGKESDIVETANEIGRFGNSWMRKAKALPRNLAGGFIVGVLTGLFEEYAGVKLPPGLAGAILPLGAVGRIGGGFAASKAHNWVSDLFNEREIKKLKSLRNQSSEYNSYIKSLRSRYKPARVNKIIKESMES